MPFYYTREKGTLKLLEAEDKSWTAGTVMKTKIEEGCHLSG